MSFLKNRQNTLLASLLMASSIALIRAQDCSLLVPATPLTATGLATPYLLFGAGCDQAQAGTSAFVQGAILDLFSGQISVYNPLVINNGTKPAITPTVPTLPTNNIVALWFGFNGATLTLVNTPGSTGIASGKCVNGAGGTIFGQFAYCNAPQWFSSARNLIEQGYLTIPPTGTASDGGDCPTTRDFMVVDQDQSDNVVTTYIIDPVTNRIAQNTAANRRTLHVTAASANGSDNRLLDVFILPTMGCKPWTVPDLADSGNQVSALPLNELQAEYFQCTQALIPESDPMVLNNGAISTTKINAYRVGVFQPSIIKPNVEAFLNDYCTSLVTIGKPRILSNQARFQAAASPVAGTNLFDFLMARYAVTIGSAAGGGLGCPASTLTASFHVNAVGDNTTDEDLGTIPTGSTRTKSGTACVEDFATSTTTSGQMSNSSLIGIGAGAAVGAGCIAAAVIVIVKRQRAKKLSSEGNFYQL